MRIMVLDIGGTAIKSAICEDGVLTMQKETPTEAALGGVHVMNKVKEIISSYLPVSSFERIGISAAGQVDPVTGSIIYANKNIPGYTGTRIKDIMEEAFHLPTCVENDVNSAAIGESIYGAGRGETEFACLTYGTGVGGALFVNGHLYHGSSCSAGEFGALVTHPEERDPEVDFYSGCYEKYASTTGLVSRAMAYDPSLTNGRIIFERMEEPAIRQIIDDWITEIVYGLITITHMLNPGCIILGGGVLEQPYVLENVREKLMKHIMPSYRHVKIRKAELGNQAGMLGASVLHLANQ